MDWRRRLAMSPWWVLALVNGVPYVAIMTVWVGTRHGHWVAAAVTAVPSGAVFGIVMGLLSARRNRELLAGTEHVSMRAVRDVIRQARQGRVPQDSQVRDVAVMVSRRQYDLLVRTRRWSSVLFAVGTLIYCALAVTRSPWWLAPAALFAGFLALSWVTPKRLRRSIDVLEQVPSQ